MLLRAAIRSVSAARLRSTAASAFRLASVRMWLQCDSIWRDTWPAFSMIVSSPAPDSASSVMSVSHLLCLLR
jgi:hypothetical protein